MSESDPDFLSKTTRVNVLLPDCYREFWADRWEVQFLDGAHTLQLKAHGDGEGARSTRNASLAQDMLADATSTATKHINTASFTYAKSETWRLTPIHWLVWSSWVLQLVIIVILLVQGD